MSKLFVILGCLPPPQTHPHTVHRLPETPPLGSRLSDPAHPPQPRRDSGGNSLTNGDSSSTSLTPHSSPLQRRNATRSSSISKSTRGSYKQSGSGSESSSNSDSGKLASDLDFGKKNVPSFRPGKGPSTIRVTNPAAGSPTDSLVPMSSLDSGLSRLTTQRSRTTTIKASFMESK